MMFINKYFLRSLVRNKFNSAVKVLGVSVSLFTFVLILIFVKHEASYDKQIPDHDRIFRVIRDWQGDKIFGTNTPGPLLQSLVSEFPEIETGTRVYYLPDKIISCNNNIYHENSILAVDSTFLQTFNLKLLQGDAKTALNNPGSVLISRSKSKLYFGDENPVGKELTFEGYHFNDKNKTFTITGVYDDYPANTHFRPDFLLTLKSFGVYSEINHTVHFITTYIKLKQSNQKKQIEAKLPGFMRRFYGDKYYNHARSTYLLQPITDIHLDTSVYPRGYETSQGDYKTLILFPLLGLFILLIAIVNYLNLTIAEGFKKAKVFGINKIIGAGKLYFIKIYFLESLFLVGISLIVALFGVKILFPGFETLMDRQLSILHAGNTPTIYPIILVTFILITLFTLIPVWIFSSKKSIKYLSGVKNSGGKNTSFQQISQALQFSICIFLLVGSVFIYKQLKYMDSETNSTMKTQNVLVIKDARYLGNQREAFKMKILNIPGVESASLCDNIPGNGDYSMWGHPVDEALVKREVAVFNCDPDYFKTLDMELVKGRFFDNEHGSDENAVVLNEEAAKILGWEDDPIGKRYAIGKIYHVVGVAKNIYFESLKYPISPQVFIPNQSKTSSSKVMVKINSKSVKKCMTQIASVWKEFVPERDMYYDFIDQEFNQWYKSTRRTSALSIFLSVIAILLSNLGLLAATLFTVQTRSKEIGIRKVNGAKMKEILALLNADFVKLVIMAFIVACPVAWIAMNKWLQNFAYRTDLSWWVFALIGIITILISVLTVTWQSWRTAAKNPVEALRYE